MVSKKIWAIIAIVIVVVAGIVIGYWAWTMAPSTPAPSKLKIALIFEGVAEDKSWNQYAYDSMQRVLEDLGNETVEVEYLENVVPTDFPTVVDDLVAGGTKLIIGHTMDYTELAYTAALKYPNTSFIIPTPTAYTSNYGAIETNSWEGYYLAGVLGALMTKTNVIGAVLGFKASGALAQVNGYKLGAQSVNENITVLSAWTATWYDVGLGKAAANAMIDKDADFICTFGSGPGIGAIDAARERGVWAVGSYTDQNYLAPQTVLTSVIWDFSVGYEQIISDVLNGKSVGKTYRNGLAGNGTYLCSYHGLVPENIANQVAEKAQDIILGAFVVPYIPDHEI